MSNPANEKRVKAIDLRQTAASVKWKIQPFVNGRYSRSAANEVLDKVNPATESTLYQAPIGDQIDVNQAVCAARECFENGSWSERSPTQRAEVLTRLADLIMAHRAELAILDTLEMGKPIQASLYDAGSIAPALLRSWAGFADKLFGVSAPLSAGTALSFNTFEPCGVVGAITPWNFPVVNAIFKIGPALAAGNSVVLKPSELSPSSALRLAELSLEAGLPDGALNIVPGVGYTVGAALAQHRDVDLLSFTGSTKTGRRIMELAGASNGKRLLIECGGKSPQLVFDDVVDLDIVASAVVQNFLWNQGQVCSAHTRVIVQETVKERLLEKMILRAAQYTPGDPLDEATSFGPLASPIQRDRVKRYVEEGLQSGAHAVLRGSIQEAGGCNVAPTIFDRVDSAMSIVQEEIFGPVLCVQTFGTEREAIELANSTAYGLEATVWTRDISRAGRLVHAIRAGTVSVRTAAGDEGETSDYQLSYEPQRASGFGSEIGLRGLESYSTLKLVNIIGARK